MNPEIKRKKDIVYAMAMLAVVRKTVEAHQGKEEDLPKMADDLVPEVSKILMNHLTPEEMAQLAAGTLIKSIGQNLREFCEMSMATYGKVHLTMIVATTESFCSKVLGRPIKVTEDDPEKN